MCLFCGCSVVLNRKPENEERYVEYLIKEMELVYAILGRKRTLAQLHFGGGTPTKLSCELLEKLFIEIQKRFSFDPDAEIAIEIDPRTVFEDRGEKLHLLHDLGFNRVSFGVQDHKPEGAGGREAASKLRDDTIYLRSCPRLRLYRHKP